MDAAIYTRISQDDGSGHGVARQRTDCEREAARLGWDVVDVYEDNDVSATRSKVRPAYARMINDIESGRVRAIVVWDVDRLTRSPRELEDIIDLADKRGLALASVGGDIDLADPQGRLTARLKGSVARHEAEQMSRRIRRQSDERAVTGRPHGRAGFGFIRIDGRDVLEPTQAAIVREAARRILAAESLRAVVGDFNARKVPTPSGSGAWTTATLRQLLLRPSLAGYRQHRGEIIGRTTGDRILSDDDHVRLVALLTDPTRRYSPGTGRAPKHLLSGLAVCGRCGGKMRRLVPWTPPPGSKSKPTAAAYSCGDCHKVRRLQEPVDEYISAIVIARLEQPDAAELYAQGDEGAARAAREAMAAIDARLETAADAYSRGDIEISQLTRITEAGRSERDRHEKTLKAAMPSAVPLDVIGERARETWGRLSVDQRRALIDALMEIRILPGGVGQREFKPELIEVSWRTAIDLETESLGT